MTALWPRCSFVAEEASDPLEGTVAPAQQWFLIEHPGPWGPKALAQSGLAAATVSVLTRWSTAEDGRVLLIRRHGRTARGGPRRWFRIDSRPGRESIRTGVFANEGELARAVDAPGEPFAGPLHLVCAHGRHDTCCAVRGRPLAAALLAAEPDRVWECSHLGGCRFAPALVLLPHGFVLGQVPAEQAPAVVRRYRGGMIDPHWLRGRSSLAPAVQAAQHHARAHTGTMDVDALRVMNMRANGDEWHVEFTDPGCAVRLRERRESPGRPLTCAATAPGWVRLFDLLDLQVS